MILIVGGAYQGKLDYAKERFGLGAEDVFSCDGPQIDFSRKCVDRVEEFCWACVQNGTDPRDYFKAHEVEWKNSILICRDLSAGVVPLGAENRLWRQHTGRLSQYLAKEAEEVVRIFCGLEQTLK